MGTALAAFATLLFCARVVGRAMNDSRQDRENAAVAASHAAERQAKLEREQRQHERWKADEEAFAAANPRYREWMAMRDAPRG